MDLPIRPTYQPMEATNAEKLPAGDHWQYEPKWDGFRCLAFRDDQEVVLQSKAGKYLTRYFPDIVNALLACKAKRFVIDGELVISVNGALSFEHLLERMSPSPTRVNQLARANPATFFVFDLLVDEKANVLTQLPLEERRRNLETFAAKFLGDNGKIQLTPMTRDREVAESWLDLVDVSLEGVIAKRVDQPYAPGKRVGMQKVKKLRTMDCIVGGFTYADDKTVSALLLGLIDIDKELRYVGGVKLSGIEGKAVLKKLESLTKEQSFASRKHGGRFISSFPDEWTPVAPKLVVEVRYDRFTGGHFRHGIKFLRWRPDKPACECLLESAKQTN